MGRIFNSQEQLILLDHKLAHQIRDFDFQFFNLRQNLKRLVNGILEGLILPFFNIYLWLDDESNLTIETIIFDSMTFVKKIRTLRS